MSVELRNLKGTFDFLPGEQRIRNEIIRKMQEVFEINGYQPIETPIMSYYDILASKYAGGDEILKEVYKFKDQGQREIGLRYDLTIPFAKVVGMNPDLRVPFKRYEIGKVFRDGPVKVGRSREFIQCDVDVVGIKSLMAEAELMIMAKEIYEMLGLEIFIAYNNRKLLSGILRKCGVSSDIEDSIILSLDKLEKIGKGNVRKELLAKKLNTECIEDIFSYLKLNEEELIKRLKKSTQDEFLQEGIEELKELNEYIYASGIKDICKFTPSLSRGLEIYTGTIFEIFLKDESITSSLGAGGRYDKIIGAFLDNGKEYPAVGLTFGLDVIYTALVNKGLKDYKSSVQVYIIPIDSQLAAFNLLNELRSQGIPSDMEMDNKRLKKSLTYAGKQGIPFVIILGEDEIKTGKLKIRNMKSGKETETEISKVSEVLKNMIVS